MKNRHKLLLFFGLLLILGSLGLVLCKGIFDRIYQAETEYITERLEAVMPQRHAGVKDAFSVMDMPALSVEGEDFIGLVEIPNYGVKLPLCGDWQPTKLSMYPCCFCGTVYDGSLVIGGSDVQFGSLKTIGHGDVVMVTDMTGAVFSYRVERITRSGSADAQTLQSNEFDLTLFIRDPYTLEYVLVRCN